MGNLRRLVVVAVVCGLFAGGFACGPNGDAEDQNDADDQQNDQDNDNQQNDNKNQQNNDDPERPDSLEERCEAACERIYDDCGEAFGDEDGAIPESGCVEQCTDDDLFRGGEWCVATEADCKPEPRDMIDACLPEDYHPEACDHLGAWAHELVEFEQEVFQRVNDYRTEGAECGDGQEFPAVEAVELNDELRCAARLYSYEWVHEDPDDHSGSLLGVDEAQDRAEQAGFDGEVLGTHGHHGHRDADVLVDHWMGENPTGDGPADNPRCEMVMHEEAEQFGFGRYDQERSTVMFGR